MDTTSNMQNMETILLTSDEHAIAMEDVQVRCVHNIIKYARQLNEHGKKSVSFPLSGTDFLHGLLQGGVIEMRVYIQLVRLAEDPTMEYKIKITTDEDSL
jgi:hypothetical protein